ncbi:hypothetical protein HNO88_003665 [Novosphingobium chloroacetimidivorans]|uniref:Transposase n=1 Tax=Novosphingobium chloroacetimidivorans TaxID=1428314 RepID=A0A7W7KCI4_9SPHN|nr:hypothetical protein [Novosphingobium chloroacetimidivorans]
MNPIEMAFSKLKALLRQEPARTVDGLVERNGSLLDRFLPNERQLLPCLGLSKVMVKVL